MATEFDLSGRDHSTERPPKADDQPETRTDDQPGPEGAPAGSSGT